MLFLLFQLGNNRYALEARTVVEVLPLVALQQIPQSPSSLAGIFNYRGKSVPAIDLSAMATGKPFADRLSTRIILIHYPDAAGENRLVGLIAEYATEMIRREPDEFIDAGFRLNVAPYLGPVLNDEHGVIQLIREQHLLSDETRMALFNDVAESAR